MSYLIANLPVIEVWIDKRYLYDFQKDDNNVFLGNNEWERGHWVSVKSIPNRALLFETYIDKFGALYDKLPISAFRWHLNDLSIEYPLDWLQIWDCLSYDISVIEKRALRFCKTQTLLKNKTIVNGEYLFTIDTTHSNPAEIDTGWSETPNEHKSYNISKIENGQFVAQPNNRTRFIQPSRTSEKLEIPYFKYSTTIWTCENTNKWVDDENWNYDKKN